MELKKATFYVGPRKTGTTWLHDQFLRSHGQFTLPNGIKETFFFDRFYSKGINWYLALFGGAESRLVEFCPSYFTSLDAPCRIAQSFDARIVISLREPLRRAVSDYIHHFKYGHVGADPERGLALAPDIVEASKYTRHLGRWLETFGTERVRIIFYEDLVADPLGYFEKAAVAGDIEIDPDCFLPGSVSSRPSNNAENRTRLKGASVLTAVSFWLKRNRLNWIVNLVKLSGVMSLASYFGRSTVPAPNRDVLEGHLAKELKDEIAFYPTQVRTTR